MHEQHIAQQILKKANDLAQQTKQNIVSITVEVGDVGHLPLEEMGQVLKTMVPYTIHMITKKAKVHCICGYEGEPRILQKGHDSTFFECPQCTAPMPKILEGQDIILKKVELK